MPTGRKGPKKRSGLTSVAWGPPWRVIEMPEPVQLEARNSKALSTLDWAKSQYRRFRRGSRAAGYLRCLRAPKQYTPGLAIPPYDDGNSPGGSPVMAASQVVLYFDRQEAGLHFNLAP